MNKSHFEHDYLADDLTRCVLCEWQCGVNRLQGETGVCGVTVPEVSSSQLHPAPPASFDAFLTGCSFRCLSCQNWPVANYPHNNYLDVVEGYYEPQVWAELALEALKTTRAEDMGADRLFFTGGEPTCSLPWIEAVVSAARSAEPGMKVNFDTNGYMTHSSLDRIISIADSITFDIKATHPELFSALTGADVGPVLRNARYIAENARDKLWEFRVMAIPGIHDDDIPFICEFIADLGPDIPLNFLAFRPNFVMAEYSWTPVEYMDRCVKAAKIMGLENVSWSGRTKGQLSRSTSMDDHSSIRIATDHAKNGGCIQPEGRNCGSCSSMNKCSLKRYKTDKFH